MNCASLSFTTIEGYPHGLVDKSHTYIPIFEGNNTIIVETHLKKCSIFIEIFDFKHEDVQMKFFFQEFG